MNLEGCESEKGCNQRCSKLSGGETDPVIGLLSGNWVLSCSQVWRSFCTRSSSNSSPSRDKELVGKGTCIHIKRLLLLSSLTCIPSHGYFSYEWLPINTPNKQVLFTFIFFINLLLLHQIHFCASKTRCRSTFWLRASTAMLVEIGLLFYG